MMNCTVIVHTLVYDVLLLCVIRMCGYVQLSSVHGTLDLNMDFVESQSGSKWETARYVYVCVCVCVCVCLVESMMENWVF